MLIGQLVLRAQLYLTLCDPMTVAHQAPQSMGFSRQEYWSGLSFPSPGDLSHPGIKPTSPVSPVLAGRFFTTEPPGKPPNIQIITFIYIPSTCPSTLSFSHIRTRTQTLPVMGIYEFPIFLRAHVGTGPFLLDSTFAHLQHCCQI